MARNTKIISVILAKYCLSNPDCGRGQTVLNKCIFYFDFHRFIAFFGVLVGNTNIGMFFLTRFQYHHTVVCNS